MFVSQVDVETFDTIDAEHLLQPDFLDQVRLYCYFPFS